MDASYWIHRTPRQRARAEAQFDREARDTIRAYKEQKAAENRRKHVVRAIASAEKLGLVLLTGKVGARDVTKEERNACKDAVKDAWRALKSERDFVTVL